MHIKVTLSLSERKKRGISSEGGGDWIFMTEKWLTKIAVLEDDSQVAEW